MRRIVSCLGAAIAVAATSLAASGAAKAASQVTYRCVSEAKFNWGSGRVVDGTRGEGRTEWRVNTPADRVQELKRQACIDSNRQCNLILTRLKRGPASAANRFRESDCVVTGEFVESRHSVQLPAPSGGDSGWVLLGQRDVDAKLDRDVIRVARHSGRYSRLRVHVLRHDIELRDMTVEYGDGSKETWPINRRVRDEEVGPEFDVRGDSRNIRQIILMYRSTNPFAHSAVQVFGLRR